MCNPCPRTVLLPMSPTVHVSIAQLMEHAREGAGLVPRNARTDDLRCHRTTSMCTQGLVLGRGGDLVLDRERRQERGDLSRPHLQGMALRLPSKKMYRLIQWTCASSVRWL